MALTPGTRLGVYEVVTQIGAGGMGEVYQATDTNLKRQVAIKVLPASVAGDADRLARFQREAEVLAALNHPNIGAIYGLEKTPDFTALVMELVEGEDLSQRIARGPLPLDEALPIAKQIADALEAAHEQGIIHRDLKPANIKVRSDGTAKVLDFGLAKAMESPAGSSPPASMSPTLTTPAMTQAGVILGTAAYMSPEQAKGRPVDRRVDVWAFGCVLFEMLTGRRAFEGDDVADTLANVLKSQPDWSALPPNVPPAIRVVIKRCLEKDRTRRVADVATVAFVLDEAASLTATDGSSARVAESPSREAGRRRLVALGLAALLAAIASVFVFWSLALPTAAPQVVRLTVPLSGDSVGGAPTGQHMIAISPEGTRFVYVARGRLFLREVSQFDARVVPVTNAGPGVHTPVFSPDGQSLAFFSADRTIKRVAVDGGAAVTVCGVDEVFGMTWHGSEIIVGRGRGGIARCPAAGGAVEQVAVVEDGEEAHGPQMLPGGDALLFTIGALGVGRQQWDSARWDRARIVVQSRSSGARKTLIEGGSDARYVPTGHILYAIGGVVFAVPFNAARQEVTGPAIPVVEGVRRTVAGTTGAAQFAVSHTGNLVYLPGPVTPQTAEFSIALATRAGEVLQLPVRPGRYTHVRASRDGTHIAVGSDDGKEAGIWIYRVGGTGVLQRLTLEGRNQYPVWGPDGSRLAFQSDRLGDRAIFLQRLDGSPAQRLTNAGESEAHVPESWSPDGRHLLFSIEKGPTFSLHVLSIADGKALPLGVESREPIDAVFSPGGRWIAHSAAPIRDTSSPNRGVFVQPFPATGARYPAPKVRIDYQPVWTPDGQELIYVASITTGLMAAVTVTSQPGLTFGRPVTFPSFVTGDMLPDHGRAYDIMPDGRFVGLVATTKPEARIASELRAVLNWTEELKRLVPTK